MKNKATPLYENTCCQEVCGFDLIDRYNLIYVQYSREMNVYNFILNYSSQKKHNICTDSAMGKRIVAS